MNAPLKELTTEYRRRLEETYGSRLRGVYLFGSYARGSADPESDVDLMIVLDRIDSYAAEINRTSEFNAELSLRFGVSISRVLATEANWNTSALPFFANVREEAIPA
jgi:predicted nucleotidyltransferase